MGTENQESTRESKTLVPWWFLPAFIAIGQFLMRTTGYSAWAAQVGQEFMLSFVFYMAMLGPISAGWIYSLARKGVLGRQAP